FRHLHHRLGPGVCEARIHFVQPNGGGPSALESHVEICLAVRSGVAGEKLASAVSIDIGEDLPLDDGVGVELHGWLHITWRAVRPDLRKNAHHGDEENERQGPLHGSPSLPASYFPSPKPNVRVSDPR